MLAWAVWLWRHGTISQGDVVIVSALTFRILHGSRDLAFSLLKTAEHFGTVAESLRVIARPHELSDAPGAPELRTRGGAIALEQVDFAYPDGRMVFHGLNLDIAAGSSLGIVGPSGGGKSTLLALIQRLYDVQGGRIAIDGQDLSEVSQDSLRQSIAVVPQEVTLLRRSVLDNIRYGCPGASDEQVLAAARAAHCDEFVREMPHGYHTMVGERGVMLSGGQRQRIGVARALLKNAPILILDEGTSALDTQSEALIQSAMERLMRERTVLAVAHRLSTIASFDRVVVLADGRVVEDGPPQVLLARGGMFRQLWDLQLRTEAGAGPKARPHADHPPRSGKRAAATASRFGS
jgi:ATP-binding cassette subfamily B protein